MTGTESDRRVGSSATVIAPRRRRGPATRALVPLALLIVLLAAWQGLVSALRVPAVILPPFSEVAQSLGSGVASGQYTQHLTVTLTETVMGFAIGALLGVISGSLVAIYPALEVAIAPYILALQTMPKVAIAPLLMVWFGFGLESKIVVAAIVAWVPVMINVLVGLRAVEPERIELLRSMAATRWQILWRLRIPNSLPYLFSGLESAVLLSLLGSVTAEFVGARAGLGYLLNQQMARLETAGVFAVLVILTAVGLALYLLVRAIHARLVFWADSPAEESHLAA